MRTLAGKAARRGAPRWPACVREGEVAPSVVVLAGPNGAGKTTVSRRLLQGELQVGEFVNADAIAQGLSGFAPEQAAFQAGRLMLARLHELADRRDSFAFETTLASRSFAPWLRRLRTRGWQFHLVFLWLPAPEFAIARVAERVRKGGHGIPDDVVRRRYRSGLRNFLALYRSLATTWTVFDGTERELSVVAQGEGESVQVIADASKWETIVRHA